MKARLALTSLAVVSGLALTGCTINIGTDDSGSMSMPNMMGSSESASEYSNTDIMFAQMMIPHHQQAVDMSTLAETRTTNPELLALAKQIKEAQAPEIQQMEAWLEKSGSSSHMGHSMDDMGMGMGGMMSAEQMTALENASGAEFDKLYLEGMIAHHEGAIDMAQMIIGSSNAEAKTLGENIVKSQSAEIKQMKQMLENMK